MTSLMSRIRGVFRSPSPAKPSNAAPSRKKSKSQGDLSYLSQSQVYNIKEKDLQHKLHSASWRGDLDRVMELSRPDKINVPDKEGRTPLLLAIARNHIDIVQHLLNEGAKMQCFDKDNRSPFIIATLVGNPSLIELLLMHLDNKNLVNIPDKNGLNPLIYAVKSENLPIVDLLVKEKYVNLDHQDKDKNTALHYSVIQRKYELIDMLVDNGADIDVQNADGQTPLMVAAKAGDDKLTDYLLDYGANKKLRDKAGYTALQLAEASGNRACIDLIREQRPVKANMAKQMRTIQENSVMEQTSNGPKQSEERFDRLFEGAAKDADQDRSDTSRILSEEKNAQSNKMDTWGDSDTDEDSDDMVDFNKKLATLEANKNEPHYDTLFGGTSGFAVTDVADVDEFIINPNNKEKLFPDDEDWMFRPNTIAGSNTSPPNELDHKNNDSNPVVLSSFLPDLARKKSTGEDTGPNWSILIYTSDLIGAGTDANVYLQIFGSKAASARFNLDKKIVVPGGNKDLFEEGQCDKFVKQLPDIGKPIKIKIGHDDSGAFSGWHLEKVILMNNSTNERFNFTCGRWLDKGELDKKIEIEIPTDNDKITKTKIESSVSSWNSSDDDSLGISKKSNPSPVKAAIGLKQIDEERMNETMTSKKSDKNDSKTKIGPPEISDLDDSDSIDEVFQAAKKPNSSPFGPKKMRPNMDSDNERSQSFSDLKNQFESIINPTTSQQPKQGLKELIREEKRSIESRKSSTESPPAHLIDLMKNEKKSSSTRSPPSGLKDLMRDEKLSMGSRQTSVDSQSKPVHLADLMRQENTSNSPKSTPQGLVDLMRAETISRQSSVESKPNNLVDLVRQEKASSNQSPPAGLKELIRTEKEIMESRKSSVESGKSYGIKELIREEKKLVISQQAPAPVQTQTAPSFGIVRNIDFNMPPPGFRNDDRQKTSSTNPYEHIDPWATHVSQDKLQLPMNKMITFDDDLDSDDEIELAATGKTSLKKGTIDQGVGAFIGSSTLSHTSIKQESKTSVGSFVDIVPEMFSGSPRRMRDSNRVDDDATRELLKKLEEKNARLEEAKLELEDQLRRTEAEKRQFEVGFKNLDKMVAEKEQLIAKLSNEKMRSELVARNESNDLIILKKDFNDLQHEKLELQNKLAVLQTTAAVVAATTAANSNANSLRSSDDLTTPLINQNQSLTIKVRELQNHIEELKKDRESLNKCKEDLSVRLDETEGEIRKQNDALQLAVLQFNMENKTLSDDLNKSKKELAVLNDLKKSLLTEIEGLKSEVGQKNMEYQRLNMEKQNVERQLSKDREETERMRKHYETEMSHQRDQILKLTEKLTNTEAKLITTERETITTQTTIDNRQRKINELHEQLAQTKSQLTLNQSLLEKERDENKKLVKQMEKMEDTIARNMKQIEELKLNGNRLVDVDGPNSARSHEANPMVEQVQYENRRLQSELNNLSEKLHQTQLDLERVKSGGGSEAHSPRKIDKHDDDFERKEALKAVYKPAPVNPSNDLITTEIQKMRKDFQSVLEKFSDFENFSQELSMLRRQVNDPPRMDFMTRRDPLDLPSLITESPVTKQYSVDQFLLKNLIQKDELNANDLAEIKSGINTLKQQLEKQPTPNIPYLPVLDLIHSNPQHQARFCARCSGQSSAYLDMLKYELGKRIEFQVAKEMSNGSDYSARKAYNTSRLLNGTTGSSYDSLYNTMSSVSRLSNSNNSDLLNTLRSKYLI